MLPSYWKLDASPSPSIAMLRLMPDSPAGSIVDLRKALGGVLRELPTKTLVVDIREHDHRCPGTREAMADLVDEAAESGRRIVFVAEVIRGKHQMIVATTPEAALEFVWQSRDR